MGLPIVRRCRITSVFLFDGSQDSAKDLHVDIGELAGDTTTEAP